MSPSAQLPNYMADLGERLIANGFPILPILPGAKCPGRYTRGHWGGYKDWSKHCTRATMRPEWAIWRQWPGCGIGVACGRVVALDIDILEDADLVDEIEAAAKADLGDTPAIRIGQAPKRLLVYRADKPFAPIKRHPIEMLANGNQFVAYAIHPGTGRPYRWPYDELADLDLSSLPNVTEAKARAFMDQAYNMVPSHLRKSTLGPDRSGEHYYAAGGDLRGTREAIESAMEYIPNDDLHYDDWIRIAQALKGALGDNAGDIFDRWSALSSKYDAAYTDKTWRRMKQPDRIGAGTIYHYAQQYGWTPDPDVILNGALAEAIEAVPIGSIELRAPEPSVTILPAVANDHEKPAALDFIDQAPGVLGAMVRWMTATAVSPQPLLSLGAALCAVGAAAGRRYRLTAPDTRSAIYVLALGESGSGKDHPRKCVRRLMVDAGLGRYLGGETIASGSALMTSVAAHPVRLFQIDEFGHFARAVLDPKSHAHHRREIMTQLTTLWSSASEIVVGTEYANQRDRPRVDIHEPCVCLYGSTVPGAFWDSMQSGNVSDGSLARFLIMEAPENYPDEREPDDHTRYLPPIVEHIRAIAAGDGSLGAVMAPNTAPKLASVPFDKDGAEADADLRSRHLAMKRQHEGTPFSAIVARYREHVRRVALIAAVGVDAAKPIVTGRLYAWAEAVVSHCLETMLTQAQRHVADNEHEAQRNRLAEAIRRFGGWMDGHTLAKRTPWLSRKSRSELLAELIEMDFLEVSQQQSGGTKPRTLVKVRESPAKSDGRTGLSELAKSST